MPAARRYRFQAVAWVLWVASSSTTLSAAISSAVCQEAAELVAALANPGINTVLLPNDVVLGNSDWESYALPIVLTRNITIQGTAARPVTVDFGFVHGKVRLGNGLVLTFTSVVVVNGRAGSANQAPGLDLFVPLLEGDEAILRLDRGAMVFRACFPPDLAQQVVRLAPRPSALPGVNTAELPVPLPPGCVNSSSAPVLDRCYAYAGHYVELVVVGADLGASGRPVANGYLVAFTDMLALCDSVMGEECLESFGPIGCELYTLSLAAQPPPPLAPQGGGGGGGGRGRALAIGLGVGLGGSLVAGVGLLALALAARAWARALRGKRGGVVGDASDPRDCDEGLWQPAPSGGGGGGQGAAGSCDEVKNDASGPGPLAADPHDSEHHSCKFRCPLYGGSTAFDDAYVAGKDDPKGVRITPSAAALDEWPARVIAAPGMPPHTHKGNSIGMARSDHTAGVHGATGPAADSSAVFPSGDCASGPRNVENTAQGAGANTEGAARKADDTMVAAGAGGSPDAVPPPEVKLLPTVLGKGAFGRVYEGIFQGQRVAVKVVDADNLASLYGSWVAPPMLPPPSAPAATPDPAAPSVAYGVHMAAAERRTEGRQGEQAAGQDTGPWVGGAGQRPMGHLRQDDASAPPHEMRHPCEGRARGQARSLLCPGEDEDRAPQRQGGGDAHGPMGHKGHPGQVQPDPLLESKRLSEFASEVSVLGRCDHPNVVRLLAACLTPPRLCLVMERCETSLERMIYGSCGQGSCDRGARGEDGGAAVEGGALGPGAAGKSRGALMSLPKLLHIGIEICQGLEYLHPLIMHRDLKPANVLINGADTDRPVAKLADFGLSRIRAATLPTMTPEAGTPAYIAPECYDPSNNVVTHDADMYALGVLLWAMLTGEVPWKDLPVFAVACKVAVLGERLPLDHLPESRCPPKLRRLIQQCWEADPRRRPAAAEAVKELILVQQALSTSHSRAVSTTGPGHSPDAPAVRAGGGGGKRALSNQGFQQPGMKAPQ